MKWIGRTPESTADETPTQREKRMSNQNGESAHPKFELGKTVATPGALDALEASGQSPSEFLKRHLQLEQGDLCAEDHELNAEALQDGSRILSAFRTSKGVKIWLITEAKDGNGHRSATTLLLPEEY
jgi:hypothetical protein